MECYNHRASVPKPAFLRRKPAPNLGRQVPETQRQTRKASIPKASTGACVSTGLPTTCILRAQIGEAGCQSEHRTGGALQRDVRGCADDGKVPFRALLWGKPRHEAGWFTRGRGYVLEQKEASLQIVVLILETLNLKTSLVKVKPHQAVLPARTAA